MKMYYNLTRGFSIVTLIIILTYVQGSSQNLQISGGNNFSSVVCNQQQVNVSGYNKDGQLGVDASGNPIALGIFRSSWAAVLMGNLTNVPTNTGPSLMPSIRQADAGSGGHLLGLDCNKNVWAWGLNDAGQLGRNNSGAAVSNSVPMRVLKGAQTIAGNFLGNIVTVSGGNNSSFAVEAGTGKVLAWGANDNGQLGDGTIINKLTPVYVLISGFIGGTGINTPVYLTKVWQIEAGDACTYALDSTGQVWSWGVTHDNSTPTSYVSYNLGRSRAAEIVSAAGGAGRCIPYAGKVQRGGADNGNAALDPTNGLLNDMVSLSGGDAHGIAIDSKGQCWTWGGDWGTGQLGQGNGGQYNDKAGRVVNVGVTATTGPFLGGGTDKYKAIFTAAGQASCAIVLQDTTDPTDLTKNRVVTFGSNGLYESGNLITQSGTTTCTGNNQFASGTIGRGSCGSTTCGGSAAQNANTDIVGYEYPQYVKTGVGATAFLSGVTTVSDGDAWYFATNDVGGNAVSWGFNRRGEQADGTFADRCYAAALTLPTSCSFDYPCPGQPTLPATFSTCPIFTKMLNSQTPQLYSTYKYNWQYRATPGSGTWTDVLGTTSGSLKQTIVTSTDSVLKKVQQIGEWRVLVSDSRASVSFLCAACPVLKDSVTITEITNPYTTDGCAGGTNSTFTVATPTTSKIKWYTTLTGGSALNPLDSNTTITVPNTTAPVTAACGAGKRALFGEDLSSTQGVLFSTGQLTPTTAQIATGVGCATGSWGASGGPNRYLAIRPTKAVKLTSVSFYINNTNGYSVGTTSVVIYANKLNGSNNEPNTSSIVATIPAVVTVPANTAKVISVAMSVNLTANTIYWIQANGSYNEQPYFNCSGGAATNNIWNTPVNDNTGNNILQAVSGWDNGSYGAKGSVFDIKFEAGTGYSCGRILVCQASGACPAPVSLLYFDAQKSGAQVNVSWATASEQNSDYFLVKRSSDGIHWTTIGRVKSVGNTNSISNYSFIDANPVSGISYYTMDQYDFDGTTSSTNIVTVEGEFASNFSVYPNPNNGQFNIKVTLAGGSSDFTLKLVSSVGQTIFESNESAEGNAFSKDFNLGSIAKGVYHLVLKTQSDNVVKKIIIE